LSRALAPKDRKYGSFVPRRECRRGATHSLDIAHPFRADAKHLRDVFRRDAQPDAHRTQLASALLENLGRCRHNPHGAGRDGRPGPTRAKPSGPALSDRRPAGKGPAPRNAGLRTSPEDRWLLARRHDLGWRAPGARPHGPQGAGSSSQSGAPTREARRSEARHRRPEGIGPSGWAAQRPSRRARRARPLSDWTSRPIPVVDEPRVNEATIASISRAELSRRKGDHRR